MRKHLHIVSASILLLQIATSGAHVAYAQSTPATKESTENKTNQPVLSQPPAKDSKRTESKSQSKTESISTYPNSEATLSSESSSGSDSATVIPPHGTKTENENEGSPLTVGGEEILRFKTTISGFSPTQRVAAIDQRITELIKKPDFDPLSIRLTDTGYSTDLLCGDAIILTVTDKDAQLLGFKDRKVLAADCAARLSRALPAEKAARTPRVIFFALFSTAVATLVLIIVLLLLAAIFPRVYAQIERLRGNYIRALKIQNAELLAEESLSEVVVGFCRVVRAVFTIGVVMIYIERVLGYFPTTRQLSTRIVENTLLPVFTATSSALTSYLPNLLIIATILISAYYLITFTNFIFKEIGREKITVPDFDAEWADPTYKIARFLIVAFSLVLIFPYLPGSGSPAFQQISLFLGVLISLGSSGSVSNIVAGIFLTYTGAFRMGDRVKIADTIGDVVERKLLYTRIRTIKDEYITIPNSMVLGAHIINYSSSVKRSGLILHTKITIGYDVPWRKVEELLLRAARGTKGVVVDPPPFVLVTELDDFYVTHQINCYTLSPHMMATIYGDLHKEILDQFANAGVEIMSPSYHVVRKGPQSTIPEQAGGAKASDAPAPIT